MPRLEVIVVAYRSRELVRACLRTLFEHPLTTGEMVVHVVDNDSRDGTLKMVREDFPAARLHALGFNAGFSVANNEVLQAVAAEYVLLLNPDTEMRPGVLDHMVALMDANPEAGMSGCRLEQLDGTFDHAAKRSFPTPLAALAHFTGLGRRAEAGEALSQYRATTVQERGVGEVDAVNGAFMLVRRQALEDVGLLDAGYWLYMEDLDWCYRFHAKGWKVLYDGTVTAIHVKGGTAGSRRRLRQNVAFHRGMGRFYRKFYAGDQPWLDVAVYLGIGAKLLLSVTRNAVGRRVGA